MNNLTSGRLQQMIDEAKEKVPGVLANIDREFQKRVDVIVPNKMIRIGHQDQEHFGKPMLWIKGNDQPIGFTPFSENQLYGQFGIPKTYAAKLIEWKMPGLLDTNFDMINRIRFYEKSTFVRHVDSKVKGWLSPSYKRIDAQPVLYEFVKAAQESGMLPAAAYNTDSRMQLRFISDEVIKPLESERESCLAGLSLSTSDYGGSAFRIEIFLIRLICLNGMIGQALFREIHLGAKFQSWGQIVNLSKQTMDLDNAAMISGVKDITYSMPNIKTNVKASIEKAMLKAPANADFHTIRKLMDKETMEDIQNLYEKSEDVMELPQEKTMWRLANAISFVAKKQEDPDKRIDMENLAMKIVA